jgi:hypothetical protein
MQLSEIGDAIVDALPELSADLETCHAEWAPDVPGAYNIADTVLWPALERWLVAENAADPLKRGFDLLEQLSLDPDQETHFWVNEQVSWLMQSEAWVAAASPFLGPNLTRLIQRHRAEIEEWKSRQRWWQFWR